MKPKGPVSDLKRPVFEPVLHRSLDAGLRWCVQRSETETRGWLLVHILPRNTLSIFFALLGGGKLASGGLIKAWRERLLPLPPTNLQLISQHRLSFLTHNVLDQNSTETSQNVADLSNVFGFWLLHN